MRILLTGCAGFIGSNIAKRLLKDNHYIVGIDNMSFGFRENLPEGLFFMNIDFKDFDSRDEFDCLIHCATANIIYGSDHPVETFKNNSEKTIDLFERFKGKIIYLSSCSVYGKLDSLCAQETEGIKTNNPYSLSKYAAEQYLRCRKDFTTLRLSNVYGPGQNPKGKYCGVINKFIYKIYNDIPIDIYDSEENTRDYTYVDDVMEAVIKTMYLPALDTEINIGTGIQTSVKDLCKLINDFFPGKPLAFMRIEGRGIDDVKRRCLNIEKAKKLLKWKPKTDLRDGIYKTIEWIVNNNVF